MPLSRRDFARLVGGTGAAAALGQLGRSVAMADTGGYRAMVGVFLLGGNDAWNMVVRPDGRYADYAAGRGPTLALPKAALTPLTGTPFGLHPSLAPLTSVWNEGALNVVLNVGSLYQPTTKTLYQQRPDLMPINLMSHPDEQGHWQGMRMRDPNRDGFMGRLADKLPPTPLPALISVAGANLITVGQSAPLVLPETGGLVRNGYVAGATDAPTVARQAALAALSNGAGYGAVTQLTAANISTAYDQAVAANAIISSTTSQVDQYFTDSTGAALTSDVAYQLLRVARMIEARNSLGQSKQVFFVSQGGFDTHMNQTDGATSTTTGTQADLYTDLAQALVGFYTAMKALGVQNNVTAFTMSDFGRVYKGNAQNGSDHAWGSNHLVVGGGLSGSKVQGAYPNQALGGPDDSNTDGRWIPTIAIEEYVGAIAQWHGVSSADMSYVFPNWSTWNGGGRGPVPFFA